MKYIKKQPTPDFFIQDTQGLSVWSHYFSSKKRKLKTHILENEQHYLCCYCEKKVNIENSHVEHVKPKKLDPARLTFDYQNLLVSCEGNHFNEEGDTAKHHCGHKKHDFFDENLFLNPTQLKDISDYFAFDANGIISNTLKNSEKATYVIDLLNLNGENNKLAEARKKAKEMLIKTLINDPKKTEKLRNYLSKDNTEFVTFLRYLFLKK